jgi:hypothetical protein
MLIEERRDVERWKCEFEVVSVEEGEVVDRLAEMVWFEGRLLR